MSTASQKKKEHARKTPLVVNEYERFLHGTLVLFIALIFVIPLLVSSYFFFPFITTKIVLFRLLVEISLFVYLLLVLSFPRYRPVITPLHWALFVFVGILVLTSIVGVNPARSFWSNAERGEGILTILHVLAFFCLLTWGIKEWKDWRKLFLVSLGISVLVGYYGIAQLLNWKTVFFGNFNVLGSGRIASTIGNASFYGGYVLLQILIGVILLLKESHTAWRLFLLGVTAFNTVMLYQTQTRGALLGLLGGAFLAGIIWAVTAASWKGRILIAQAFVLTVLAGVYISLNTETNWIRESGTLRRLFEISRQDVTTQSRLAAWEASWKGWKERFFLGWGYENYGVPFNKYFPTVIYRDEGSQVWFDRAHNIVFELGVTSGVMGLVAYGAIFVVLGYMLYRVFRAHPGERLLVSVLAGGVAGYVFQNLFVFDTIATYIAFYAVLAWCAWWYYETARPSGMPVGFAKRLSPALVFPVLIALAAAAYIFNIKPANANHAVAEAILVQRNGDLNEAVRLYRSGIDQGTYMRFEATQKYSDLVVGVMRDQRVPVETRLDLLRHAEKELERNITDQPLEALGYVYLMNLYNAGDTLDPTLAVKLEEVFRKAVKLSPTRAPFYYSLGQARLANGDIEGGLVAFGKGVELAPHVMEAHWNYGAGLVVAGHIEEGEAEFRKAAELGLDLESNRHLRRVVRVWSARRDFRKMAQIYEKIVRNDPNAADYAQLAAVYKELGEKEKAVHATERAIELDSSYAEEGALFIEQLKGLPSKSGSSQGLR